MRAWAVRMAVKFAGMQPRAESIAAYLTGHGGTRSGVDVNEHSAMQISALWCGVNMIANSLGIMPLQHYQTDIDDDSEAHVRTQIVGSKIERLFQYEPNPEMSAISFITTLQMHVLLAGNGYAEIEFDGAGRVVSLWPLNPHYVHPERRKESGELVYRVEHPDPNNPAKYLPAWAVLHIAGLGYDGIQGYSVVHIARESLGLSIAQEEYASSMYGNGAMPGGILSTDVKLKPEAVQNLRSSWSDEHQGLSNAHRVAILHSGLKWTPMQMNAQEIDFINGRMFQLAEVARWLNIPPHLLRDLSRSTNNNIEYQGGEYVKYTMLPWMVRWEQEITRKLLWNFKNQHVRFDADTLLRGDFLTRMQGWKTARDAGFVSANDIRFKENMNPIPGDLGNFYLVPANFIAAQQLELAIKNGQTGNSGAGSGKPGDSSDGKGQDA